MRFCAVLWSFFFIFFPMALGQTIHAPSEVQCHGNVPQFTHGSFFLHDNETYHLRFVTNVELTMDLNQQACFQVDIEDNDLNVTAKVTSLFYSVAYKQYLQYYPVRATYQFGIPEFQSYCKCDCPQADEFCTIAHDMNACSKGEICVTKYYANQKSTGCQHQGPASLCCEITVAPLENRRFTAIKLGAPLPQALISIQIYALFNAKWVLFRSYQRSILPYKGNNLHLNGYENVADMRIVATANAPQYSLSSERFYFFEDQAGFVLKESPKVNDVFEHDVNKYGWLRYENGHWAVPDAMETLHDIHRPHVQNCKHQTYIDRYSVNTDTKVIRNSTGAINAQPNLGEDITDSKLYIEALELSNPSPHKNTMTVLASHTAQSAPTLKLEIGLQQRMSIVAHVHLSYLEGFVSKINLDMHSNRYLNITLIQACGQFAIEIYRDVSGDSLDLQLSIVTELPFATNYSEILALPGHIASPRFICLHAVKKPDAKLCQWAKFERETVHWFELKKGFVHTEGACPGCNEETESTFWTNLNPKSWLNGIGSFSEGVALFVECIIYFLVFIAAVTLIRKVIFPFCRWAFCGCKSSRCKSAPQYEHVYSKCDRLDDSHPKFGQCV